MKKNCITCGAPLCGKQTQYCSVRCKNAISQSYPAQRARGINRKIELINHLGGKCEICGYNKNLAGLTLHHTRGNKNFQLDTRSLSNRTIDRILIETEKCQLVCQNCHMEIHNPSLNLAELSAKPTALTTELRAQD